MFCLKNRFLIHMIWPIYTNKHEIYNNLCLLVYIGKVRCIKKGLLGQKKKKNKNRRWQTGFIHSYNSFTASNLLPSNSWN